MGSPAIAVHVGAGRWDRETERIRQVVELIHSSLDAGMRAGATGSSLDMVVEAVRVLEDSGTVNAGAGSTVDLSGSVSMDAGVMYSKTGRAGAVAYVRYPRNPVVLARFVLEQTDHVLVAGEAADLIAERLGLPRHPGVSERVRRLYEEAVRRIRAGEAPQRFYSRSLGVWLKLFGTGDTVGAVAVDREGELAAATSTGGVFLKMPGRVGDSPIVGAGFYASGCGAASATGIGEFIVLYGLSRRAVDSLCAGGDPVTVAEEVLRDFTGRYGRDTAGFILMDRSGRAHGAYNTQAMPWGYASREGVRVSGL